MLQLRRLVTVAGVLALLAGPAAAQTVSEVQVSPENLALRVGERKSLFPAAFDRTGNVIPTTRFTYRSSAPGVASVDADGAVIGRSAGSATIEVRAGTRTVSVPVTVTGGGAAVSGGTPGGTIPPNNTSRIIIDPATVYLVPSESQRLVAKAIATDGTVLGPVGALWRSLTPGAISVDSITGNVVGLAAGIGTIEARLANGLSATAPAQVNAVPFETQRKTIALAPDEIDTLRIQVPAQNNRRLEAGLTFSSTNPNIVQIGPTGVMQARGPGQVEIIVTGYFQEARVVVTVHRPIAYFDLQPGPADGPVTVPIRGYRIIKGVAEAADSTPIPEAPLRWEVTDSSVAVYDPATGRITGKKQGTTTLQLSARGYQPKVWTINVVPGVVVLDRERKGMKTGDTLTVGAHLKDEAGNDFGPAPDLTWTSDHPEMVRVTGNGRLDALAPGRALVVATANWGRADTLDVIVTGDILLTSDRKLRGTSGLYQLALGRPDSLLPLVVDTRQITDPALSPDRRRIVFAVVTVDPRHDDRRLSDLWVADADGRNARAITSDSVYEAQPAWTADGQRIVFTTTGRREGEQLAIINADGTGRRTLTVPPGTAEAPAVSPDGRTVAFIGVRDRKTDLYVMDLAGGPARLVGAQTQEKELQVRWLPNGDLVTLVDAGRDKGFQVVRVAQGTNARSVLAVTPYPVSSFGVSRDGATVAYVTTEPLENVRNQRTKTVLYIQPVAAGSTPTAVRTPVSETLGTPTF
ncbi:MAG TPA: Ig-like domain-containing protein [Gemmatimonadales bacterium]|nr:Ig-like domain-containing protein [Gemmatimonadales bacterium]